MDRILKKLGQINLTHPLRQNVTLAPLTTFKLGGPADFFAHPTSPQEMVELLRVAREIELPVFILGQGANLLISDKGIRGLVIETAGLDRLDFTPQGVTCGAGLQVSKVIEECRNQERSALEFLYSMPSSIGGAVWMNARCYGSEISEHFEAALCLTPQLELIEIPFKSQEWEYKVSPFQVPGLIILEAQFHTKRASRENIEAVMRANESDRESKGHFRAPCAGSIFKNNRAFGNPSGVIIDQCGLKGLEIGGAQVATWHGNIIIARPGSKAAEVRELIEDIKKRVLDLKGFELEEEVIYAGEW